MSLYQLKKKNLGLHFGFFAWMVLVLVILSALGIHYVYIINEQVALEREIAQTEKMIATCQHRTSEIDTRLKEMSRRWIVLESIDRSQTRLVPTTPAQLEQLRYKSPVATVAP